MTEDLSNTHKEVLKNHRELFQYPEQFLDDFIAEFIADIDLIDLIKSSTDDLGKQKKYLDAEIERAKEEFFDLIYKFQCLDEPFEVYREMKVDYDDFIEELKKGYFKEYKGIGVYWSRKKKNAQAFWEDNYKGDLYIIITALVNKNDVDWWNTLLLQINPIYSMEDEIRLKEGTQINITEVDKNWGEEIIPFEEMIITLINQNPITQRKKITLKSGTYKLKIYNEKDAIFYHGTIQYYLNKIMRDGLEKGEGQYGYDGVFLTKSIDSALHWARIQTESSEFIKNRIYEELESDRYEGNKITFFKENPRYIDWDKPIILEIHIPSNELKYITPDFNQSDEFYIVDENGDKYNPNELDKKWTDEYVLDVIYNNPNHKAIPPDWIKVLPKSNPIIYKLNTIPFRRKEETPSDNEKLRTATDFRTDGETHYSRIIAKKYLSEDMYEYPIQISEYVLYGYEYENEKRDDTFFGIYTGKVEDWLPILLRDNWFEDETELIEIKILPPKDLVILFADHLNCNGDRLITEQIIISDDPIPIKSIRKISQLEIREAKKKLK